MIVDERPHIRELGIRRILKTKHEKAKASVQSLRVRILQLNGLQGLVELE